MGEFLSACKLLSYKLQSELLIERTHMEIALAIIGDVQFEDAKYIAKSMLDNHMKLDYLVEITARLFVEMEDE